MKKYLVTACATLLLGGCATLPNPPAVRSDQQIKNVVDRGTFDLCETELGGQVCLPGSNGISARGLGGLFLPLSSVMRNITFTGSEADVDIQVNTIAARCTDGAVTVLPDQNAIRVGNIACNWIVIGNVIASVTLELDSLEAPGTFGGRYTIQFSGTGNGAGSGHFRAERRKDDQTFAALSSTTSDIQK